MDDWGRATLWTWGPVALAAWIWYSPDWFLDPVSVADIYLRFLILPGVPMLGLVMGAITLRRAWRAAPRWQPAAVIAPAALLLLVITVVGLRVFFAWQCWDPSMCGPSALD